MRVEYLYSGSKWEILQALAKKPRSTSELADELQTSSANVSQQLKQLELAGIIERRRATRSNIHYTYHITGTYTHVVHVAPGIAQQQTDSNDDHENLLAALFTHEHATALLTLILGKPELFSYANAIGILKRNGPEIVVLADNIEPFRQNASLTLPTLAGEARIAIWSHTSEELAEGIDRQDAYFINLAKEATIAYDPRGELLDHKERAQEKQK